ncbi:MULTISPECIES: hypothetical protein [Achromobacter]|uniref:hypothetical protein n=1 Tax=Achromobacter TaxID=222 RepID=UPI0023FA1AD8|nr:hypothetical protein [Achromobacter anxifer]MDF8363309.1 hypothetical protein [Achromobacter anxifer]
MTVLTAAELASRLHNRQYGNEITSEEEKEAGRAGLLIVFGASDDLLEFRGAFRDQAGAYDSATVQFHAGGALPAWDDLDKTNEDDVLQYFEQKMNANQVTAHWDHEGYSWFIEPGMGLGYAVFDVLEDDERYCRGIVIDMARSPREWRTTGRYHGLTGEFAFNAAKALRDIFPADLPEPKMTSHQIGGQPCWLASWRNDADSLAITFFTVTASMKRLRLLPDGGRHFPVVNEGQARDTVDAIMVMGRNVKSFGPQDDRGNGA